jgi:S-adenosylmethionine-dependent methyltransferase
VSDDAWERVAQQFTEQYESLFGQVRRYVLTAQLRWHLPPSPVSIVDVGGGGGQQAIALARHGHDVTLLDPSAEMLDRARRGLDRESQDVVDRVHLVQGPGEDALGVLAPRRFDAVLCHGVVPYLDDPAPMVATLATLAQPGGVVSIVAKNARTLAMRHASEHNWDDTLAAFDATREVNRLGLETRGDTPERLTDLLARYGVTTTVWYGVRLFTEGWGRDVAPVQVDDNAVLAAELEASRRDPYRQLSRLFHIVGTRSGQ